MHEVYYELSASKTTKEIWICWYMFCHGKHWFQNVVKGSGKMAQELRAFPALPEDWSLVPRTHVLGDSEPSVTPDVEYHLPSSGFYKYLHTYNITQPSHTHTHTNTMLFLKSEAKDDLDLKAGPINRVAQH